MTTPEQYPLTLNAATNGANQKSNRDPVLSLDEDHVAVALERLVQKYLARKVFPGNSRVEKYCHNGKDGLGLETVELAIMAELLMRGPQTAGELRTRASRMEPIDDLDHLRSVLRPLVERNLVQYLTPVERRGAVLTHGFHEAQEREQLRAFHAAEPVPLSAPSTVGSPPVSVTPPTAPLPNTALEAALAETRNEVAELKIALGKVQDELQALKAALGV